MYANIVFQACISFLVFQEREFKEMQSNFLSHFTSEYLVFEVFQTRVVHVCFCLVRINMPLLMCCGCRGGPDNRSASSGISKPMVCQTYVLIYGGYHQNDRNHENDDEGHLQPVTLEPVSRTFRNHLPRFGISSDPCFSGVRGSFRIFRIFPVSRSKPLISKI